MGKIYDSILVFQITMYKSSKRPCNLYETLQFFHLNLQLAQSCVELLACYDVCVSVGSDEDDAV